MMIVGLLLLTPDRPRDKTEVTIHKIFSHYNDFLIYKYAGVGGISRIKEIT